jgi:hypothetical protein
MEPDTTSALLFMPDISGFTQFVTATEISHSQHIIAELLQTLIDNNHLGLSIVEIEGDAIFFYKSGGIPSPEQIASQCRKMFIAFHRQLKKYDLLRICNCGACSTANQLTLKFVVHQGEVSFITVNNQTKLFGPDVILIHRLLKNDIPEHEYMLLTDRIAAEKISPADKDLEWIQFTSGSAQYDIGHINFQFSPFKSLYASIPEPPRPELKVYRVPQPARFVVELNAPMRHTYSCLMDLKSRITYLPGVLDVRIEDERHNQINKLGTQHECIRNPAQDPAITTAVALSDDKMVFTETAVGKPMSFDYIVEKTGEETSRLTLDMHLQLGFVQQIMFNLMMKKKLMIGMNAAIPLIKESIEKSYREQSGHDAHAHEHQASSLG